VNRNIAICHTAALLASGAGRHI